MDNKLKDRLEKIISEYQKIDRLDLSESQRHFYDYTEQAFKAVLDMDQWIQSSAENKQCYRIFQIAKMRSRNEDVSKNLLEVELYTKIKEVLPYIMASSYVINNQEGHLTQDLIKFCQNQLELIDEKKKVMECPDIHEVNKAFECYFNHIKPNRIPSLKVYDQPETRDKIGELYDLFDNTITTYNLYSER